MHLNTIDVILEGSCNFLITNAIFYKFPADEWHPGGKGRYCKIRETLNTKFILCILQRISVSWSVRVKGEVRKDHRPNLKLFAYKKKFNVIHSGLEPETYCLEGSCSIQVELVDQKSVNYIKFFCHLRIYLIKHILIVISWACPTKHAWAYEVGAVGLP